MNYKDLYPHFLSKLIRGRRRRGHKRLIVEIKVTNESTKRSSELSLREFRGSKIHKYHHLYFNKYLHVCRYNCLRFGLHYQNLSVQNVSQNIFHKPSNVLITKIFRCGPTVFHRNYYKTISNYLTLNKSTLFDFNFINSAVTVHMKIVFCKLQGL